MDLVCLALQLYVFVVFGRVILSWFPVSEGSALQGIDTFLRMLTEPVLGPLRRAIPALRMGGMAIDLSPMILIFGVIILQQVICAG
ncbi:MAG TPA: YggT family protein [Acidimicrobiales bacterium]|jgi:YggT family protein|nr:YggT family protein [Acidimicrobiales bacterium]